MLELIYKPRATRNYLATIAIGSEHKSKWKQYILPNWLSFCRRHDVGLVVVTSDLINPDNKFFKKATWQKLLLPAEIRNSSLNCESMCYLDTDIIISPYARNPFELYRGHGLGIVSAFNGIPFDRRATLIRVAALRQTFVDHQFPLDSALHFDVPALYEHHNLPVQKDFACMGFFMADIGYHSELMKHWFFKYTAQTYSMTNGDQAHFNYEIFSNELAEIMPYEFQALWIYEIANEYPFLYNPDFSSPELKKACVESTLLKRDFLHFAGSYCEGSHWKLPKLDEIEFFGGVEERISEQKRSIKRWRARGRIPIPK